MILHESLVSYQSASCRSTLYSHVHLCTGTPCRCEGLVSTLMPFWCRPHALLVPPSCPPGATLMPSWCRVPSSCPPGATLTPSWCHPHALLVPCPQLFLNRSLVYGVCCWVVTRCCCGLINIEDIFVNNFRLILYFSWG